MGTSDDIYAEADNIEPDDAFVAGNLQHLVEGNRGRMLDPRRTPVTVVEVVPARGEFSVSVDAFEDAGAIWDIPLFDVDRFQFRLDSESTSSGALHQLKQAELEFSEPLAVEATASAAAAAKRAVAQRRQLLADQVREVGALHLEEMRGLIAARTGAPRLFALVAAVLQEHGLQAVEDALLRPLISNPRSGEMVKGHAIVAAELGLVAYRGTIVRRPDLFEGEFTRAKRSEHLLWRLALTQEVFSGVGPAIPIYRGISDLTAHDPGPRSFISATFSRAVAESHFEAGPDGAHASLAHQPLPVERLFMTFAETAAMNERYEEAEALLLGRDFGSGS